MPLLGTLAMVLSLLLQSVGWAQSAELNQGVLNDPWEDYRYSTTLGLIDTPLDAQKEIVAGYGAAAKGVVTAILNRDYDTGERLLAELIESHPNDQGQRYRVSSKRCLTASQLEHGRSQFNRMMADRPVMLNHLNPQDVLSEWAIRQFAGEHTDFLVSWNPDPPAFSTSNYTPPRNGEPAHVRVAKVHTGEETAAGRDLTFEELWSHFAFEMHNVRRGTRYLTVCEEARSGAIARELFIYQCYALEHEAMQETRAFYARIYLVWARVKGLRTDPRLWHVEQWGDAPAALERYWDRTRYPWSYYGDYFDRLR